MQGDGSLHTCFAEACFPLFLLVRRLCIPSAQLKHGVCPAHPAIFSAPVGSSGCPAPQASPELRFNGYSPGTCLSSSLNLASGSQPCICLQSASCRWHQCLPLLYFLAGLCPSFSFGDKSCTVTQWHRYPFPIIHKSQDLP